MNCFISYHVCECMCIQNIIGSVIYSECSLKENFIDFECVEGYTLKCKFLKYLRTVHVVHMVMRNSVSTTVVLTADTS